MCVHDEARTGRCGAEAALRPDGDGPGKFRNPKSPNEPRTPASTKSGGLKIEPNAWVAANHVSGKRCMEPVRKKRGGSVRSYLGPMEKSDLFSEPTRNWGLTIGAQSSLSSSEPPLLSLEARGRDWRSRRRHQAQRRLAHF
ncbi:uncharacterized protein NECHADRAFT_76940 [Fusarium vanettenii 77-13-4]|uniref:Uncharacterized protein n=1 Tax=Fusarium vanettenii (strain ATCC MYA-4622 / CBS 123669 / FGSC 9596 / NRRL 45880 / 77-13-4) TaxID=660122 RepID=C7ZC62_FUSV7|nr:uncharacterized protein NECHADRAFT_76940 [Fusarium vanettenii 77-13-4]EEU38314.1 predicted protein [Fusarium vanettenii 77-13-4]